MVVVWWVVALTCACRCAWLACRGIADAMNFRAGAEGASREYRLQDGDEGAVVQPTPEEVKGAGVCGALVNSSRSTNESQSSEESKEAANTEYVSASVRPACIVSAGHLVFLACAGVWGAVT